MRPKQRTEAPLPLRLKIPPQAPTGTNEPENSHSSTKPIFDSRCQFEVDFYI